MTDTIVQEVRDARAAIAERFGYDRALIIAWAREQTQRRNALDRKSEAGQPGTGQPPTRSESDPESGGKPQLKWEGRSQ